MPGPHDERTFETGVVTEMVTHSGWQQRPLSDYDRKLRLIPADLEAFIRTSQPEAVEQLEGRFGDAWPGKVAGYVAKSLKLPGDTLRLMRKGKVVQGIDIDLAHFKPTHGLNPEIVAKYDANILTVVRQVPYSPDHGNTLDLGLFVNGLPVADAELKNGIGQKVGDAVDQYRTGRDRRDMFLSRRSVVHFAVDPDRAMMATQLDGKDTQFLPFNRGASPDGRGGAGNYPPTPEEAAAGWSHKTSYLWRQVWQRDLWLELLARFVHVSRDPDESGPDAASELIFPRYHQWECVRRLVGDAREHGSGHNYLVEHSTGAGKTNEIGWLAHQLANLFDADEVKAFDKVVVVTDRIVLDRNLQEKIEQFEQKSAKGMVRTISKGSPELREALESKSAKIVVTTVQKFPHIARDLDEREGRRFAVIVDEAHSGQTGDTAADMKFALTKPAGTSDEELLEKAAEAEADYEVKDAAEELAGQVAAARARQEDLSMFAFTATPKSRTLELYGTGDADTGERRPFHVYSMRQAIEEGFILDVLANYTTYETYYRLACAADGTEIDSNAVGKSKALTAARRYATLHPHNIAQKVVIIVEHFREHVQGEIGGQAKAMVVTSSRLAAVRYKFTIDKYLAKKGYDDIKALVAFSGTVIDPDLPGEEFTEPNMNRFPESVTEDKFDTAEYQVMVVAEKYQTGFNQPLLQAMYVDKKLAGVNAVQTLGRLNRTHPGKDKTFVLDFVNDADTIQQAFSAYYDGTVAEPTDPQVVYETWERLDDYHVVEDDDVDAFAAVWFDPTFTPKADGRASEANAALFDALRSAEERFAELDEEVQDEFRQLLRQFTRQYAFLSQVVDYSDTATEKRHVYCRMLADRVAEERGDALDLSDELRMTHYHVEKSHEGRIEVAAEDGALPPTFTGGGYGGMTEDEQLALIDVIRRINDRYGFNLDETHRLPLVVSIFEWLTDDPELQQKAVANSKDKFKLAATSKFEGALFAHLDDHTDLVKQFLEDPQMQEFLLAAGLDFVYRRAAEKHDDG